MKRKLPETSRNYEPKQLQKKKMDPAYAYNCSSSSQDSPNKEDCSPKEDRSDSDTETLLYKHFDCAVPQFLEATIVMTLGTKTPEQFETDTDEQHRTYCRSLKEPHYAKAEYNSHKIVLHNKKSLMTPSEVALQIPADHTLHGILTFLEEKCLLGPTEYMITNFQNSVFADQNYFPTSERELHAATISAGLRYGMKNSSGKELLQLFMNFALDIAYADQQAKRNSGRMLKVHISGVDWRMYPKLHYKLQFNDSPSLHRVSLNVIPDIVVDNGNGVPYLVAEVKSSVFLSEEEEASMFRKLLAFSNGCSDMYGVLLCRGQLKIYRFSVPAKLELLLYHRLATKSLGMKYTKDSLLGVVVCLNHVFKSILDSAQDRIAKSQSQSLKVV